MNTKKEFNEFVESLELQNIYLKNIEAEVKTPNFEPKLTVEIESKSTSNYAENKLSYSITFSLNVKKDNATFGKISLTFLANYNSRIKPKKELIDLFEKRSLYITLWPYFRFWVQTIVQSWGWPPLTLPLLKQIPQKTKSKPQHNKKK